MQAREHGFECLLHEKPFAGLNGTGKHNNWSRGGRVAVVLRVGVLASCSRVFEGVFVASGVLLRP